MERRKHHRVPVEYAGSFLGDGITATGVILDLSMAGCRARSDGTIGTGELLQVLIDVPRYQTPLQVKRATVRWSNGQVFGLEFTEAPTDDQERLRELILATSAASLGQDIKK
jgi:PilZ domain-containing protein